MLDNNGSSFSLTVIRRILDALFESGPIRKTNLAGKTGLNYPNCIRYIDFLKLLGWVKSNDDGTNSVSITELGKRYNSIFSGSSKQTLGAALQDPELVSKPEAAAMQLTNSIDDSKASYNIMLVDDEPDILLTYKVLLAEAGYNVDAFMDAKSALQNLRSAGSSHYSLIVTDIRMKNINGLQFYREIQSIAPDLKVIFISALDAVEELVSILPGVTKKDIIKKPVEQAMFVKIVKEAIRDARADGLSPAPTVQ